MRIEKTFGLLGEHLAHSHSPLIHSYLGDYEYRLFEVSPDDLDRFMRERAFDGINVTIPYKQAVLPYCETLSDEARALGSVNTIIKDDDGSLHGYNTDYHGFQKLLLLLRGSIDPKGKKMLVLGDGGAARSVRAVLGNLGVGEIVTISRRGKNNYNNIERHFDADLIINTTPVGMYPDNGNTPLSLEGFSHLTGVVDLIYNPLRTALLLEAERSYIMSINGLHMLTAQAEMASRLFVKAPPRPKLAEKIADILLYQMQNIALIGMPGCGKSTAGRILAEMMGRTFIDIDERIEIAAGKSIPQIFSDSGESAFRELETRILREESKKTGIVIATGGGIVTQHENYDLLRQNSTIVYLKRDESELSSDGRPLSQSAGVTALAKERLPLYEGWCDHMVEVDANPVVTAKRVLEKIT